MPDPIPTCFRGGEAAEATTTTSVYETHLGLVALTWSRNVLGLSLRVDLRVSLDKEEGYYDEEEEVLRFRIRPWLLWKRRGGKRFEIKDHPSRRHVQFMWDLTRARFPSGGGGPEPTSGFFVSMDVDGEMVLVAGDLREEAYKKTKAQRPPNPFFSKYPVLISRREHVVLGESTSAKTYNTTAIYNGKEREISIDLGGAKEKEKERGDSGMLISIDGKVVLQIRRLKWKFRGSQKVEVDGGDRIQVSWDLHNWLFRHPEPPSQGPSPTPQTAAVFVFRFEGDGAAEMKRWEEAEEAERCSGKKGGGGLGVYRKMVGGYFGKINGRNWSESSSGGGEKRKGRKKRLVKTSSSSSMSSMSSNTSSSSVMEWASAEEVEMQRGQGFSLLVYAWKR
ncbi:uncharacterized protein [Typha latifolia]|uniref:uncharacterized protein n=1 Tax=Typha latifolia TaxID=4733 RepID=UPI003C2FE1AB